MVALPKHPAFRLFGVAALLWLSVVFYSYGIFHKYHAATSDYGQHPKELHPAGEFLRSAKSILRKARQAESDTTGTLQEQASEACRESMHPNYVDGCIKDVEQLKTMNPPVAYHYVRLLTSRKKASSTKDDLLKGATAEHPCMKINSESHRHDCYKIVLATNDWSVAQKIATLVAHIEDQEPVGITLHDAKIACALAIEKGNCIHDVMGTGDLESAEIYDKHPAPKQNAETGQFELQSHHHKMSQEDAVQACKMVHADDRDYCKEHVMKMDDEETAEHYVHLLQDAEASKGSGNEDTISEQDASALCASLKNTQYKQQCLQDIWVLPNKHVADHFIHLYDLTTKSVTETEAEKLCNHLSRSHHNHETCIETLAKMDNGAAGAAHYSALLKSQRQQQQTGMATDMEPRLTAAQAQTVCQDVPATKGQNECQTDVQTLNDLVMAQKYAAMLVGSK